MRHKIISYDGKLSIEVKKRYTQKPYSREDLAVINLCARDKVTLTDIQMAIVDCLDGTLEFKIHPEYKGVIVYVHKAQGSYGKKYTVENDVDSVLCDLADQVIV